MFQLCLTNLKGMMVLVLLLLLSITGETSASFLRAATADRSLFEFNSNSSSRIVGGDDVEDASKYPFFADWHRGCGGALVAPDIVLTAAHCEENPVVSPFSFGGNRDNQGPVTAEPESYRVHPDFTVDVGNKFDVMLVKLKTPVPFAPLLINRDPAIPLDDQELTVMGYGALNENRDRTDILQEVNVHYISNCKADPYVYQFYNYIFPYPDGPHLCAGVNGGGQDSCFGDSGGPLFFKDQATGQFVVVGVVSWGDGCARPDAPGVYARISSAWEWIRTNMCEMTSDKYTAPGCNDPPTESPSASPTLPPTFPPTPPPVTPAPTPLPTNPPSMQPVSSSLLSYGANVPQPSTPYPTQETTQEQTDEPTYTPLTPPPTISTPLTPPPTLSTPVPTGLPTTIPPTTPTIIAGGIRIDVTTDNNPSEISYVLIWQSDPLDMTVRSRTRHKMVDAKVPGFLTEPATTYSFRYQGDSVPLIGKYYLHLQDGGDNGYCCASGAGGVNVYQEALDGSGKVTLLLSFDGKFGSAYDLQFQLSDDF